MPSITDAFSQVLFPLLPIVVTEGVVLHAICELRLQTQYVFRWRGLDRIRQNIIQQFIGAMDDVDLLSALIRGDRATNFTMTSTTHIQTLDSQHSFLPA